MASYRYPTLDFGVRQLPLRPPAPPYRYSRANFINAGQDSYAEAPAQDTEMFQLLQNTMPVNRGTIQKRWGYTIHQNNIGFEFTPTNAYQFQSDITFAHYNVFTAPAQGGFPARTAALFENGGIYDADIFPPVGNNAPRMVLSRSWGYFANGTQADLIKWDGTIVGGFSNTFIWGIDINGIVNSGGGSGGPVGPNTPAVGASGSCSSTIQISFFKFGDSNETDTPCSLGANNFGFALPANLPVAGISISAQLNDSLNGTAVTVQLVRNGSLYGAPKSITITSTPTTYTFGSSSDLWGAAWIPSDINNALWGVNFSFQNQVPPQITGFGVFTSHNLVQMSAVSATVQNGSGGSGGGSSGLILGGPIAGNITIVSGRTYFVAFQNSHTTHCSDLSKPSASTGPLTAQAQPISGIPVPADLQVDTILLLATADGGDETNLYLVAALPAGTTTYTDNTDEATLLASNLYVSTDEFGTEFGLSNNAPPPANMQFPIKHRGRIYGLVGTSLFYSKNVAELTTASNTIAGKFEEAWPPFNFFDVSQTAEEPRALLSDGINLYIGTERHIIRLQGDSPSNFSNPDIVHSEAGVLSQDAWNIVFLAGQPIGAMWLTPDFRVIGSDFNSYQDVGHPVQDVLNSINNNFASGIRSAYFGDGPFSLWLLAVPTGSSQFNNVILVFDLMSRTWLTWVLTDAPACFLYDIKSDGSHQFIFSASATSSLYVLDKTTYLDRNLTTSPQLYPTTGITSWLDLYDPVARKLLNEIEVLTGDPGSMTVSVSGASIATEFTSPNTVVSLAPLVLSPRGEYKVYLATARTSDRYYQFTFTTASQNPEFLHGYHVEVTQFHKV